MSAQSEALEAKRSVISSIPKEETQSPDMPMDRYSGEALFLHKWCAPDKGALTARGLDWGLAEDIPARVLAADEAQSIWGNVRFGREEAMAKWLVVSPAAYTLRDDIIQEFRFAFHPYPELHTRVEAVAEGSGDADMIQDLNDLAVIGRENPKPLKETNFDMALLDEAARQNQVLGELRADASVDKDSYRAALVLRNQAYTHLKEAVDEVRRVGRFVFRKEEERLKGYRSEYKRQSRRAAAAKDAAVDEALSSPLDIPADDSQATA